MTHSVKLVVLQFRPY